MATSLIITRHKVKRRRLLTLAVAALPTVFSLAFGAAGWCEDFTSAVKKPVNRSIDTRIATQKDRDAWAREQDRLMGRYDALEQEKSYLSEQLVDLRARVDEQQSLNASLTTRIEEARQLAQKIRPFLETVYDRLNAFIKADMSFLQAERLKRLARLRKVLDDAEVGLSEKFRTVMETVSIEAEYGNTTEVYQAAIFLDSDEKLFNVFRLGRMALFCQSLDQQESGYFNVATSRWARLPDRWNRDIQAVIEMSQKKRPVDLVRLPLGQLVIE